MKARGTLNGKRAVKKNERNTPVRRSIRLRKESNAKASMKESLRG